MKDVYYIFDPVILPLPDIESFREFPVFGIPTTELPVQNTGDVSVVNHNILKT